jgi:hypothetical protein
MVARWWQAIGMVLTQWTTGALPALSNTHCGCRPSAFCVAGPAVHDQGVFQVLDGCQTGSTDKNPESHRGTLMVANCSTRHRVCCHLQHRAVGETIRPAWR